ncbi:hypothetical protein GCM10011414_00750 [Croceivirga lutea]|uniref:hypothetical protein n=1 Tax=Croceivirga lutea TaxID=1775167 RepID=UPI00163A4A23|nr:hypothetical protein [Croceivirga lutea]GGG35193.1 hypothetical protein GCM10011414_00750 [Croceivirga lutea]
MTILNKIFGKGKNFNSNTKSLHGKRETLSPNSMAHGFPIQKRHSEKIINKIVEIEAKEFVGSFSECHFINCEIKIRCAAKYTFVMTNNCTFENCLIWAHKKQIGGNWNPIFKDCIFKGRFELRFENKLINCNFSQAKLSYVGLLKNEPLQDIKGIAYPTIAILKISENFQAWEQIKKPDDFEDLVWTSKKDSGSIIMNLEEHTNNPKELWNNLKELPYVQTSTTHT